MIYKHSLARKATSQSHKRTCGVLISLKHYRLQSFKHLKIRLNRLFEGWCAEKILFIFHELLVFQKRRDCFLEFAAVWDTDLKGMLSLMYG